MSRPASNLIRNVGSLARTDRHECALRAIADGIEAAHPQAVVGNALALEGDTLTVGGEQYRLDGDGDLLVVGGGKPAGAIAAALSELLGDRIDAGVVVTEGPAAADGTDGIDIVEGTHPLPSKENAEGARRVLDLAAGATEEDLVLTIVGGGGSALLSAPAQGLSVEAYRSLTDALLRSGATIDEINAVRKHLSRIKGGQLARALAPATVVGLVFSDVVGDRLDVIASGPTAPDATTYGDALAVLERYGVAIPDPARQLLEQGKAGERRETPDENDGIFTRVTNHVLANSRTAIDAAARTCEAAGYTPVVLSSRIEGEAREVGTVQAGIVAECLDTGEPFEPPVAVLSGGETTVTVRGDGRGGPNQEFALSAAVRLARNSGPDSEVVLASVDTDGIDGASDVAGAIVDGATVEGGQDAEAALADNDAFGYLDERDALVRTGPTGTNVNDLRVVLIGTAESTRANGV